MKKKTIVSIVASSVIAPMVLHQVAAADEQTEGPSPIDGGGPCSSYWRKTDNKSD